MSSSQASDVSSGEGVARLTEYLNQTRRQAQTSIDCLSEQLQEATRELTCSKAVAEQLAAERDYYCNYAEQLKLENSKKWRLQERDDWKSLVESIQVDRTRLQDECHRLEVALEEAQEQLEKLRPVAAAAAAPPSSPSSSSSSSSSSAARSFFFGSPINTSAGGGGEGGGEEGEEAFANASPRAMSKQLKLELSKAHQRLEVERAASTAEKLAHEAEIKRLREELERTRKASRLGGGYNGYAGGGGGGGGGGVGGHGGAGGGVVGHHHGRSNGGNSLLGFLNFFFSSHPKSIKDMSGVLHV